VTNCSVEVELVPYLASHILGRMAKLVPQDWQRLYAHAIYWLETFVDPARFKAGAIARRIGLRWGVRQARGHNAHIKKAMQPIKELLGLPLTPHFSQAIEPVR